MSVRERVRMCQLIECIVEHKAYSVKLGVENRSRYRGVFIQDGMRKNGGNEV